MSKNRAVFNVSPESVLAVLSDPRAYARFVVGSKRIRRFDPSWPEVDSVFHHTLGVGPFILRDLTRVVEATDRRLVLRAQMRPMSVNRVAFLLHPAEEGTEVEVEEYAIEGPVARIWNPVLDAMMWLRNQLLLRRLKKLAVRREHLRRSVGQAGQQ